jgi:thioester reductase-like protein
MLTPSSKQTPKIFLTGGTGVVGQALLERLDPSSVTCLVRQATPQTAAAHNVVGNICQPRFGLGHAEFEQLADGVDYIIHAAAVTDFSSKDELVFKTNVDSLQNIFEFASLSRAPLYHISTAFVRPCAGDEEQQQVGEPLYAISKRRGECLVRNSGLPHVIIRPSIVIGDSKSGVISRFQGFHSIIGTFLNGSLPMMPASPEAYIDFIPQDTLADAIVALLREGTTQGEYWITSGDQSLTITRIGSIVKEFSRRLGRSLELPRFMSRDTVDRLIRPVFLSAMSPAIRKRFERLLDLSSYLCIDEPFATSMPELRRSLRLLPVPDLEQAFENGLDYWARTTGFLRRIQT